MLNDYINENYLKETKIKELHLEFNKNKNFPNLVLKDFFNNKVISRIEKEIRTEKFTKQESDLFSFSQTEDLLNTDNKILKKFYKFLNSKEFKEYVLKITKIKAFGKIDASAFIYAKNEYLLPHDDRLEKRKIAYVINLSKEFTNEDGGSLDFFEGKRIIKSILPSFNTLTIFKVIENKTFHQVSEVLTNKERISIAGWFNK